MINLQDLLTSSGKHPERAKSPELTDELKANAAILLEKVNALLADLGIKNIIVSSGFRTSAANASISNAAKKSLHMQCKAIDIVDDKIQSLSKMVLARPELLKKYGLWIEDPTSTIGQSTNWVHLDIGNRSDRPVRMFKV